LNCDTDLFFGPEFSADGRVVATEVVGDGSERVAVESVGRGDRRRVGGEDLIERGRLGLPLRARDFVDRLGAAAGGQEAVGAEVFADDLALEVRVRGGDELAVALSRRASLLCEEEDDGIAGDEVAALGKARGLPVAAPRRREALDLQGLPLGRSRRCPASLADPVSETAQVFGGKSLLQW
jgi:hypothetical protein